MKKKIFKTVRSFLKEADISYTVEDDIMFRFTLKGEHSNYEIRMICDDDNEVLLVAVSCGMCVPKDKIERMCRWITETNYTMFIGGFTMDTEDGELNFRMACPLEGGAVNSAVALSAMSHSLNSFEDAYEDLVKAMYMDKDDNWELKLACATAEKMKESCSGSETDKRMSN